jgi:dipeptidyl aminopeptidase/acylaminoacyl peptidase
LSRSLPINRPVSPRLLFVLAGTAVAAVLAAFGPPVALAAFPGANGDLAFPAGLGSVRDQSPVDLFSLSAKGATRRLAGGAGYQGAPAWSADGRRLAYATDGALVVVTGGHVQRLALGRPAGEPAWAPDGARLAFTSAGDVFTVRADGRAARRVTSGGGSAAPAWSPSGAQLAFITGGELLVARPDGTTVAGLAAGALSADWAPDGARLVVSRRATAGDQRAELWIVGADGAVRQLTGGHDDLAARWSPDGRQVAFVRGGDVWTVPAAGGTARRVTSAGDIGAALAWQPVARHRR